MILGLWDGGQTQTLSDAAQYLKVPNLPILQAYLDPSQSWSSGMISSYYVNQCSGASEALITVPMLVGPISGGTASATLSSTLSTGGPITSLPVNPVASTISNWTANLISGSHSQQLTIQTPVSPGATTINIAGSITPNFAYPSGTIIDATGSGTGQTTSPQNPSNVTTPTTMTLSDVAAGIWDSLFSQTFQTIVAARSSSSAILRIGWELYGNGWYPWNGPALASAHQAAYIHLVTLARSTATTYNTAHSTNFAFQFDWNGGLVYAGYDPMTGGAWPGASYVDYISGDIYDESSSGSAGWTQAVSNMNEGITLAQTNGKLYSMPEFGLGSNGDDPDWLEAAYYWMRANASSLGYVLYFGNLSGYPNSQTIISSLYGAWTQQQLGSTTHRYLTTGTNRYRVQ